MATFPSFSATVAPDPPSAVITRKDRRVQLFKHLAIVVISIATVVLTTWDVIQTSIAFSRKRELTNKIDGTIQIASVIHDLQKERGLTAMILGLKFRNAEKEIKQLHKFRKETNDSILTLKQRQDETSIGINLEEFIFLPLLKFREKIDNYQQNPVQLIDHLHNYTRWVERLISILPQYTVSESLEDYANLIFAYQMIIQSKEEAGLERALGGLYFVQGNNFSRYNTNWYNQKRSLAKAFLDTAFSWSKHTEDTFNDLTERKNATLWLKNIDEMRDMISKRVLDNVTNDSGPQWFKLMTHYNDLLLELQEREGNLITDRVKDDINLVTTSMVARLTLLCFTSIVVPCLIISLVKVQKEFFKYTLSLFDKVGLEQARTEFIMQENARHVSNLATRWKRFSKTTPEHPNLEESSETNANGTG